MARHFSAYTFWCHDEHLANKSASALEGVFPSRRWKMFRWNSRENPLACDAHPSVIYAIRFISRHCIAENEERAAIADKIITISTENGIDLRNNHFHSVMTHDEIVEFAGAG